MLQDVFRFDTQTRVPKNKIKLVLNSKNFRFVVQPFYLERASTKPVIIPIVENEFLHSPGDSIVLLVNELNNIHDVLSIVASIAPNSHRLHRNNSDRKARESAPVLLAWERQHLFVESRRVEERSLKSHVDVVGLQNLIVRKHGVRRCLADTEPGIRTNDVSFYVI